MRKYSFFILSIIMGCSYNAVEFDQLKTLSVIDHNKYILIEPDCITPQTCFIFYPGALVEPESYISLFQKLSEFGYRVIILKATADLAIINTQRATKVMTEFTDINNWIIGGHSLGGVVAVKSIVDNPDIFKGLVLLASYPSEKDDISNWEGAVISISAENDLLSTPKKIENSKQLLPQAKIIFSPLEMDTIITLGKTFFYEIKGGNHAQFGDYGEQKDDGKSTITKDEQHKLIIEMMHQFFIANKW